VGRDRARGLAGEVELARHHVGPTARVYALHLYGAGALVVERRAAEPRRAGVTGRAVEHPREAARGQALGAQRVGGGHGAAGKEAGGGHLERGIGPPGRVVVEVVVVVVAGR